MHYYAYVIVSRLIGWPIFGHMIWIIPHLNSHNFFIYFQFVVSDEGRTLETLDYTIRIGSTLTFLYFNLYLLAAYAVHSMFISFGNMFFRFL